MTNQPYTTNIPFSTNNPSDDQPIMMSNNNSIPLVLAIDHYAFNDNNGGYHKQVNLVNEANPGTPGTVGSVLFSKNNEWWFQNASLGVNAIQMTSSANFPVATVPGRSFLPGGVIMQWGFGTTNGAGSLTQAYVSNFTVIFTAQVSANSIGNVIANINPALGSVTITTKNNSGAAISALVHWLVIGI